MFGAGTDTSSLVLELAMAELMRNPQLMTKLQAEVRVNTPRGQQMVAQDDIASMTFLRAVVKETLRLHPPAPLLLPHLAMVECEVDGYTIPEGTRVIINEWAIGRDPESWEKPEQFMPERFTEGGSAAAIDFRGNDFQFVPSGHYYRKLNLSRLGNLCCPGFPTGNARLGQKRGPFVPGLATGTKGAASATWLAHSFVPVGVTNRDKRSLFFPVFLFSILFLFQ